MIHSLSSPTLETLEDNMVFVEGGSYTMGGKIGYDDSFPEHNISLRDFYLCRYPVTQILWESILGADLEKLAFLHPRRPVACISWYDAVEFCNRLSEHLSYQPVYSIDKDQSDPNNQNESDNIKWTVSLIEGANGFYLPTEAEWEYAAHGGRYMQTHAYAGSPNYNEVAWWRHTSQDFTQPVGLRIPNALGLFDMSGNVYEWVWDWYDANYYESCARQSIVSNPTGANHGKFRGVRGGSWGLNFDDDLRVAYRYYVNPDDRFNYIGFRVSRYV